MVNSEDKDFVVQELETQLKQLRAVLHQTIEDAMLKIARTCAGISPDIFAQVIASVFPPIEATVAQKVAVAAPAKTTERPSSKSAAKQHTASKRRGRHAVWANSSDSSLRQAYRKRAHKGLAIEPDLEAELVKRFQYYDVTTHKFMGAPKQEKATVPVTPKEKPSRAPRKIDWTKSSDDSLRQVHANRVRNNKQIEPELEAELVRRFPTYDATTHKFMGRMRKEKTAVASTSKTATTLAPKATEPAVFTHRVDNEILALTRLHSYKNKAGNYQLMFDGKTMLLRGGVAPFELILLDKKTKTAVVRKIAKDFKHKLYIIKCKKGKVVEAMKMGARDIKYIPETRQFLAREAIDSINRYIAFNPDGTTGIFDVAPDAAISIRARQTAIKETFVIEEDGTISTYELISLGESDKTPVKTNADAVTRQATPMAKPKPALEPMPEKQTTKPSVRPTDNVVAQPAPQKSEPVKVASEPAKPASQPEAVETQRTVSTAPKTQPAPKPVQDVDTIEQEILDTLRNIEKGRGMEDNKPAPVAVASVPAEKPKGELQVTVKSTRMSLDGVYSDVFVNGKRILRDHMDTKVELFLDGTYLGVHGIVTDNPDLPTKPMWQVYNTELRPRMFNQRHMFTKKLVYIEQIKPLGEDKIVLQISNKMRIILEKRNTSAVFKILENMK